MLPANALTAIKPHIWGGIGGIAKSALEYISINAGVAFKNGPSVGKMFHFLSKDFFYAGTCMFIHEGNRREEKVAPVMMLIDRSGL